MAQAVKKVHERHDAPNVYTGRSGERIAHGEVLSGVVTERLRYPDRSVNPDTGTVEEFYPLYTAVCRLSQIRQLVFGYQPNASHLGVSNQLPRAVREDSPVLLHFRAPENRLSQIRILFATYARVNSSTVCFEIFEQGVEGPALRSAEIKAYAIQDNTEYHWEFQPLEDSAGTYYTVRISATGTSPTDHVAVWGRAFSIEGEDSRTAIGHLTPFLSSANFERRELLYQDDPSFFADEVFLPIFRAESRSGDGVEDQFGWEGNAAEHFALPLTAERRVSFAFRSPTTHLGALSFLIGTRGHRNHCCLTIQLFEVNSWGEQCHRVVSELAASYQDGEYAHFEFEPIPDALGKWFKVYLSSPDASPTDHLVLFGAALVKGSTIYAECEKNEEEEIFSATIDHRIVARPEVLLKGERLPRRLGDARKALSDLRIRYVAGGGTVTGLASPLLATLGSAVKRFEILAPSTEPELFQDLRDCDYLIYGNLCALSDDTFEELQTLTRCARYRGIPVIGVWDYTGEEFHDRQELRRLFDRACYLTDGIVSLAELPRELLSERTPVTQFAPSASAAQWEEYLHSTWVWYRKRHFPTFSLIAPLYSQGQLVHHFLSSVARQSYRGRVEITFIDDRGGGPERSIIEQFQREQQSGQESGTGSGDFHPEVVVLENDAHLGDAISRNRAIARSQADVLLFVDAGTVLSRELLEYHARAYAAGDTDVALGFTAGRCDVSDPFAMLGSYESDPIRVRRECPLRDRSLDPSYLNCSTQGFSVRREFLGEDLFDEQFTPIGGPPSGVGYEGVDLAIRLIDRGARLSFVERSIVAELRPAASEGGPQSERSPQSLRHLVRLVEKHPRIPTERSEWFQGEISFHARNSGLPQGDLYELSQLESAIPPKQKMLSSLPARPLRILTYRWHCAHQYELYRLPHEFHLVEFPTPAFGSRWEYGERPLRSNAHFVSWDGVNVRDYDLALLHFDENVLAPENCRGKLPAQWGDALKMFVRYLELPKVAICHGTPQFYGQFTKGSQAPNFGQVIEEERERLVELLGEIPVVLNSYQAQREWGFSRSHVVWHGFDPVEFRPSTYQRGVLTLGKGMTNRPHYRGYHLFQEVSALLGDQVKLDSPYVPEPDISRNPETNEYAWARFENYRRNVREYSVYFNPTLRSPMPRLRGEAMISGLVTVSAQNHDVERFIEHGQNGFYSNDPRELAEILVELTKYPTRCREIGAAGRKTAQELFSAERFRADWQVLLGGLV